MLNASISSNVSSDIVIAYQWRSSWYVYQRINMRYNEALHFNNLQQRINRFSRMYGRIGHQQPVMWPIHVWRRMWLCM